MRIVCLVLIILICFIIVFFFKTFEGHISGRELSEQSYGLRFNGHEALPEKRTALELSSGNALHFSGDFRIEFDLNFIVSNKTYFGYILRIINDNQNIDLIYDQGSSFFRLIIGQKFSGISFTLDSLHLFNQWSKFSIVVEPIKHTIQLWVNGKLIGSAPVSIRDTRFEFLWGANDDEVFRTRDIPPMRIKDIKIFEKNSLLYNWSLNEFSGDSCLDEIHQKKITVKNGNWIKPLHQNWSLLGTFVLQGNAVVSFDAKRERLFLAGSDSVFIYDVKDMLTPWIKLPVRQENIQVGSQAIYDTLTDKLYDVLIDHNHKKEIATWSLRANQWDKSFIDSILTEYLHANKFISPLDTSLYIIGGYGLQKYKNIVQRYHFATKKWDTVTVSGDFFPPRYLAALGTTFGGDTAYIMGGHGSVSGDQMLNPGNYYDLYAFNVRSGYFKKLFDLNSIHPSFVFANSLIIDSKAQRYYGLIFPNDRFNSNIQLITGSLKKPSYRILGNQIPFLFYDLQSFADLYYSPTAGKFIAVTLFYPKSDDKNKFTTAKIYSINFPPELFANPAIKSRAKNTVLYILLSFIVIIILLIVIFSLFKHRLIPKNGLTKAISIDGGKNEIGFLSKIEETSIEEDKIPHSQILLFGQFQVLDKEGVDITELFTPLLKELFLLLLIYSIRGGGRGISPNEINEILWNGKSIKDAKNNRSVNFGKLKNILEKVGNYMLIKQSGFWQFQMIEDSIYIDYEKFVTLFQSNKHEIKGSDFIKELLDIAGKGAFLLQTEYDWLDNIKSEVSNLIIDTCLKFVNSKNDNLDPEFIIEIANCVFYFDQLNENALEYKCRSLILLKRFLLANKSYIKFCKDYKSIYGEEFHRSFNDIVNDDSPMQL